MRAILLVLVIIVSSTQSIRQKSIKGMSEALEKAVERTKQWQSTDRDRLGRRLFTQDALRAKATQPIRMESLDVHQLNRLIKTIDRTWTLPKAGSTEPVGSNFQAKAYIHQQLTRCFASAVCENAILLSGIVIGRTTVNMTNVPMHLQAMRINKNRQTMRVGRKRTDGNTDDDDDDREMGNQKGDEHEGGQRRESVREEQEEEATSTTKKVPFWQRLLVRKKEKAAKTTEKKRKTKSTESNREIMPDEEEEEERWIEKRFGRKKEGRNSWRRETQNGSGRRANHKVTEEERFFPPPRALKARMEEHAQIGRTNNILQSQSTEPIGFWKNFQPGKWFQSVHYITNTG